MNEQDFYDTLDRVVFIEHYRWGIIRACWYPDGRFSHVTVMRPIHARP
jgi:hypothetical protein